MSCAQVISLQTQNFPPCFLLSKKVARVDEMISPTFPSSPSQFLLCPAHQTKARSHRAISEDSSPEIPSHFGEMVLMGRKKDSQQSLGDPGYCLSSKGHQHLLHNPVSLYLTCPLCSTGSFLKGHKTKEQKKCKSFVKMCSGLSILLECC